MLRLASLCLLFLCSSLFGLTCEDALRALTQKLTEHAESSALFDAFPIAAEDLALMRRLAEDGIDEQTDPNLSEHVRRETTSILNSTVAAEVAQKEMRRLQSEADETQSRISTSRSPGEQRRLNADLAYIREQLQMKQRILKANKAHIAKTYADLKPSLQRIHPKVKPVVASAPEEAITPEALSETVKPADPTPPEEPAPSPSPATLPANEIQAASAEPTATTTSAAAASGTKKKKREKVSKKAAFEPPSGEWVPEVPQGDQPVLLSNRELKKLLAKLNWLEGQGHPEAKALLAEVQRESDRQEAEQAKITEPLKLQIEEKNKALLDLKAKGAGSSPIAYSVTTQRLQKEIQEAEAQLQPPKRTELSADLNRRIAQALATTSPVRKDEGTSKGTPARVENESSSPPTQLPRPAAPAAPLITVIRGRPAIEWAAVPRVQIDSATKEKLLRMLIKYPASQERVEQFLRRMDERSGALTPEDRREFNAREKGLLKVTAKVTFLIGKDGKIEDVLEYRLDR